MRWLLSLYRRIAPGFIRFETPDTTQKVESPALVGLTPRYRRTQDGNRRQLRIVNPRIVRRIKAS